MKIFIALAAFNEYLLEQTIRDAIYRAKHPENLVFGILDQHMLNRRESLRSLPEKPNIRYIYTTPVDSRGACWARYLTFSLYQDEEYILQIDSHTVFSQDWDETLISELEYLRSIGYTKPLLTAYPPAFSHENGVSTILDAGPDVSTMITRPSPGKEHAPMSDENAIVGFHAFRCGVHDYVPACHVSGGFFFTLGKFSQEVPYDPNLYFWGEEQSLAIRAFTRGWDMFHPKTVPLYHLYGRPEDKQVHHWHSEWERQRDYNWHDLDVKSRARLRDLLFHKKDLGVFGLGADRSLSDFADYCGIDYEEKKIRSYELLPTYPKQ